MSDLSPAKLSAKRPAHSRAEAVGEISISLGSPDVATPRSGWGDSALQDGSDFSLSGEGYLAPVFTLSPATPPAAKAEPTKKLSVAIPRSLHKTLKQLALDEDETMGELITKLLQSALDQNGERAIG